MYDDEIKALLKEEQLGYSLIKYLNNIDFEKELIAITKQKGFDELKFSHPMQEAKEYVILALTFLALKYYDGSLWSYVHEKYPNIFKNQHEMEINILNKVLKPLTEKYNCKGNYYQIPVINAIIPFKYLADYFDFAHDIYVKNLDCSLECDLEQEIKNIFNSIANMLNDKDDNFSYEYDKNSSKTYKLIIATKRIIKSGFKQDELILITKNIIHKINDYYNNKNINTNYYIDESFNKWLQKNQNDIQKSEITSATTLSTKSNCAYFSYDNNEIYLHTQILKIPGDYDPKLFKLEVLENEEVIYKKDNLIIRKILGGLKIETVEYLIKNPLNKISVRIFYNDKVIDNTDNSLFRDYLLFDDNKELKNNKSYNGSVYFIYKQNCDDKLTQIKQNGFYKVAYANVNENDEFVLDNNYRIIFTDTTKSQIIGNKIYGLELTNQEETFDIYNSIHKIILVANIKDDSKYKIRINNIFLDSFEYVTKNNAIVYILNSLIINTPDFYIIELIDITKNKIIKKYEFLYDPNIKINQTITNNESICFQYAGTFNLINKDNKVFQEFNLLINNLNKDKYFLNIHNIIYECIFSLTIPYYQIDDKLPNTFHKYLASEDFDNSSKLFFNIDNCNKVTYTTNANNTYELTIKTLGLRKYVELSGLINFKDSDLIKIQFFCNDIEKENLLIYNKPVVDLEKSSYSIDWSNEEVIFKTVIYGKKSSDKIFIELSNKNVEIQEQEVNDINIFKLNTDITRVDYCIYQLIKQYSGFELLENKKILQKDDFSYFAISQIMQKYLLIDKIEIEKYKNKWVDAKNLYIKLVQKINEFEFIGYLYYKEHNNMNYYNEIKTIKVIVTKIYYENKYHCLDVNIWKDNAEDKNNSLLQFDERHDKRNIVNGFNKKSLYISKYRINLTLGKEQYEKFKSNTKS